jgi:hypothetical protein
VQLSGANCERLEIPYAHAHIAGLYVGAEGELKVFTAREGGVQHSSFDNSANAGAYIADWVAETLGGRVAQRDNAPPRQTVGAS